MKKARQLTVSCPILGSDRRRGLKATSKVHNVDDQNRNYVKLWGKGPGQTLGNNLPRKGVFGGARKGQATKLNRNGRQERSEVGINICGVFPS